MPDYQWKFEPLSNNLKLSTQRLSLLPDTCFWKSRLQNLFQNKDLWDAIGLVNHGIYLFSGPIGSGRHMTGNALIGELPNLYGFDASETAFLYMRAEDFPESMTVEDAENQVNDVFEAAAHESMCIIVFDAMDHYAHLQIVSNFIADYVEENAFEAGNLVVVCYVEDESLLSFDLRSMAFTLRTNEPTVHQRTEYLLKNIKWDFPNPNLLGQTIQAEISFDGISIEELVNETEHFTYGDLSLFVKYLRISALSRMKNGGGLLLMFCSKETVQECIDAVKNKKHEESIQIVQVNQDVGGKRYRGTTISMDEKDNRITALAGKSERSFAENMELIQLVTASGKIENDS